MKVCAKYLVSIKGNGTAYLGCKGDHNSSAGKRENNSVWGLGPGAWGQVHSS